MSHGCRLCLNSTSPCHPWRSATATLGMEPWSLCDIWPIHLQRLRVMVVSILSCWHSSKRTWFEIIWGQKILTILQRFLVWKDGYFDMSFYVKPQHSDPYSRVERTQLLYNFIFVCVLHCCDFHTGLSILKAFLALPILLMMSLPTPPLWIGLCMARDLPLLLLGQDFERLESLLLNIFRSW